MIRTPTDIKIINEDQRTTKRHDLGTSRGRRRSFDSRPDTIADEYEFREMNTELKEKRVMITPGDI